MSPLTPHGLFTATAAVPVIRLDPGVVRLGDGRVMVAGGWRNEGDLPAIASADVFDPDTGTWSPTGSPGDGYGHPTATRLLDSRVLLAGDVSAALYDQASGQFAKTGPMIANGGSENATLLADGRVLFTGGSRTGTGPTGSTYLASAQLYDPATGRFTRTGSMTSAREHAQAVRLDDGRILVVGGDQGVCEACGNVRILSSAEIYDPATGKFTRTGSMRDARTQFSATLLNDGRVLVAGGVADTNSGVLATAEIYDPATGRFSSTGSMTGWRIDISGVRLGDGRVLFVGGKGDATAEIYDPATGVFSATGSMSELRDDAKAVALLDGRVLVFGGETLDATAELYWP